MEPCPSRADCLVPSPTPAAASSLVQHPVAPCPSFLYTATPAFPWAPRLRDNSSSISEGAKRNSTRDATAQNHCHRGGQEGTQGRLTATQSEDLGAAYAHIKEEILHYLEDSGTALSSDFAAHLEVVFQCAVSSAESGAIMVASGLQDLPEELILPVISIAATPLSSHARCCCVAQWILLPSLRRLQAPPTKGLSAAISHLGEINPQALLERCFSPLLAPLAATGEVPPLTQHHSELLVKAIKSQTTIPKHLLPELIKAACGGSSSPGTLWTENIVVVLQAAVDTKPDLSLETLAPLTTAFHGASGALTPSIKLGKLILATVKGYALQCDEDSRRHLYAAARTNGTFMAKPALAALDALAK